MVKKKKKNKYNSNNINDYTKKNFLQTLMTGMYIFDYKIVIYWLPISLYIIILSLIIGFQAVQSPFAAALISSILIYILYFTVDIIYQILLCKNTKYYKLVNNSLLNAIYPALFVLLGYILSTFLKETVDCPTYNINVDDYSNRQTMVHILDNTHRNKMIVTVFFYIFSIFYINPVNKKKCINNNLC